MYQLRECLRGAMGRRRILGSAPACKAEVGQSVLVRIQPPPPTNSKMTTISVSPTQVFEVSKVPHRPLRNRQMPSPCLSSGIGRAASQWASHRRGIMYPVLPDCHLIATLQLYLGVFAFSSIFLNVPSWRPVPPDRAADPKRVNH